MNRFFKVFWPWLMVPVFWLVVGLLLFAMCGCARVQYIPVETVRVDSVYGVRWFSDSTFLKDSIYTSNPQLSSSASFLRLNVLSSLN